MDISHADGTQESRELHTQDYNAALSWALEEVQSQWEFYRERYEKELK